MSQSCVLVVVAGYAAVPLDWYKVSLLSTLSQYSELQMYRLRISIEVFLLLLCLFLVVAPESDAQADTVDRSDWQMTGWGEKSSGLSMRVSLPRQIKWGDSLPIKIELRSDYDMPSGMGEIDRRYGSYAALHLDETYKIMDFLLPPWVDESGLSFIHLGRPRLVIISDKRDTTKYLFHDLAELNFALWRFRQFYTHSVSSSRAVFVKRSLAEGVYSGIVEIFIPFEDCRSGWSGELFSPEFTITVLNEVYETDTLVFYFPRIVVVNPDMEIIEEKTEIDSMVYEARRGFSRWGTVRQVGDGHRTSSRLPTVQTLIPNISRIQFEDNRAIVETIVWINESSHGVGHMATPNGWGHRIILKHEWSIEVVIDSSLGSSER